MPNIKKLLSQMELHDSLLESINMNGQGQLDLIIAVDEVWNKDLDRNIKGLRFHAVYEISNFKPDCLNVIGTVAITCLSDYQSDIITFHDANTDTTVKVHLEFVAGGSLTIICKDQAEFLV